jgi:hypothetical protein
MIEQQTVTPERQIAASQVGAVFNSMHEYLRSLEPKKLDESTGNPMSFLTEQLKFAHCRIDEAAMWAIKSVLTFGVPPRPAAVPDKPAADSQTAANDTPQTVEPTPPGDSAGTESV